MNDDVWTERNGKDLRENIISHILTYYKGEKREKKKKKESHIQSVETLSIFQATNSTIQRTVTKYILPTLSNLSLLGNYLSS